MIGNLAMLVLHDPTFRRLSERARLRYLELVFLADDFVVKGGGEPGVFIHGGRPMPAEDLAWCLHAPAADLSADLDELLHAGLLACEAGAWRVVDFQRSEPDAGEERRRRWREQKRSARAAQRRPAAPERPVSTADAVAGSSADNVTDIVADAPARRPVNNHKDNKEEDSINYPPHSPQTSTGGAAAAKGPPSPVVAHYLTVYDAALLTRAQLRTLNALETRFGTARVIECIDWAAETGIEAARAVRAIKSAVNNWQPKPAPARQRKPVETGQPAEKIDPDLEYLRVNPFGAGRAAVLARLKQKGLLPEGADEFTAPEAGAA